MLCLGWKERGGSRFGRVARLAAMVLIAMLLAGGLGGCAHADRGADKGSMVVVDGIGREVEIPCEAARIAALDSFSGEAIVMAGAGPQLCACPAGTSSDVILQKMFPALASVPAPLSGGTVNIESLAACDPDVVLIKSSLYYAQGEAQKLDKMGIPYLVVEYSTMEDQIAMLDLIGTVCGGKARDTMAEICDYYRATIATVEEHAAAIPAAERISVYHAINEIVRTDGSSSLGADWVACVGADDVSADEEVETGEVDYTASLEQIYLWDPDVIICNSAGTVSYALTDSKWQGLRAVKEGRVLPIPVGATRWGQRGSVETYFAMLWLGCTIYPEYYADIDLKAEVLTFYREILGVEVSDEQYELMLAGEGLRAGSAASSSGTA